jgi:hypothetical protein
MTQFVDSATRFVKFLGNHGLVIIGTLGFIGATSAGAAAVYSRIALLEEKVRHERELQQEALKLAEEKARRAVADAQRATAERFVQLGFTEEYRKYQSRVGLADNDSKDG